MKKYCHVISANENELHIFDSDFFKAHTIFDFNGSKQGIGYLELTENDVPEFVKEFPEISSFICGHRCYEYRDGELKFRQFLPYTAKSRYKAHLKSIKNIMFYKDKYKNVENGIVVNRKTDILGFKRLRYCNNKTPYTLPFALYTPKGMSNEKIPLVIFLHGMGNGGESNIQPFTEYFHMTNVIKRNIKNEPCIMLVPSTPKGTEYTIPKFYEDKCPWRKIFDGLFEKLVREYPVDLNRIYIVGASNGAGGVWSQLRLYPDRYAAAIPMMGWSDDISEEFFESIKNVPIWASHAENDMSINIKEFCFDGEHTFYGSDTLVEGLKKAGSHRVKYTRYTKYGHRATNIFRNTEDWYSWLFSQKRSD